MEEICKELSSGVESVRSGNDEEFKKNMQPVKMLPTFVLSMISSVIGFVSGIALLSYFFADLVQVIWAWVFLLWVSGHANLERA